MKKLAARYAQVEEQLARSIRYTSKDESGDAITVRQAWFNGSDDLTKVAVESRNGAQRDLTEYFALDFDNDYDGMFMLVRKETPAPDGGVQVEESRKYFGEEKTVVTAYLFARCTKARDSKPANRPTRCIHRM